MNEETKYCLVIPIKYLNDRNYKEKEEDILNYIKKYQLISWAFSNDDLENNVRILENTKIPLVDDLYKEPNYKWMKK
jgi:hypothetical protein